MMAAGAVRIKQIVAKWKDENGKQYILFRCGRCGELMLQRQEDNLQTTVVLGEDCVVTLRTLPPHPHQFTAVALPEA